MENVKEYIKNKIKNIISEMISQDVDEMAAHANPVSRVIKAPDGDIVGHDMRLDPHDENSRRINVLYVCDIEEFLRKYPEYVAQLKEQYGNIRWVKTKKCRKHNPHEKKVQLQQVPGFEDPEELELGYKPHTTSGQKQTVQEKMKVPFLKTIREEFDANTEKGTEFNNILKQRSLPPIILERTNINQNLDEWTNDKLVFETHTVCLYKTYQDFMNSIIAKTKGEEGPEVRCTYQSRLNTKKMSGWEKTRKNVKKYIGQTPIYNLPEKGFVEENYDVNLFMRFIITGELMGSTYVWTVKMKNEFSSKLPEDFAIRTPSQIITLSKEGYLDDKTIGVIENIQLDPNKTFDEENTVMDDVAVMAGLIKAINDFKEKITKINNKSLLTVALKGKTAIAKKI
jgi:hypothetical protein